MNKIDKILKEADENGLKDEIIENYERIREENESLNLEIESLKYKNHRLQIDNSKSTTESFRKSWIEENVIFSLEDDYKIET